MKYQSKIIVVFLFFLILVSTSCSRPPQKNTVETAEFNKIREAVVSDGLEIYKTDCAGCHGEKGEGEAKGIPLISGHAISHSFDEYLDRIRDGKDKKMPAFSGRLTEEEISAVAKYVREVIQNDVTEEQRHSHHH